MIAKNLNNNEVSEILALVKDKKKVDFSDYQLATIFQQLSRRVQLVDCSTLSEYYHYLLSKPEEIEQLFDFLTINVSHFFRNPLTYEFIDKAILHEIISNKIHRNDGQLRIWSAGCSAGEEPYSIAILVREILEKERLDLDVRIFATDIDDKSLTEAKNAKYNGERISQIKQGLLKKYFTEQEGSYSLLPVVQDMVSFSNHNLLDEQRYAPAESIFGHFDLVLCRNILIYYKKKPQHIIINNLYRSISANGFLVLGESEDATLLSDSFVRINKWCSIYRKGVNK